MQSKTNVAKLKSNQGLSLRGLSILREVFVYFKVSNYVYICCKWLFISKSTLKSNR